MVFDTKSDRLRKKKINFLEDGVKLSLLGKSLVEITLWILLCLTVIFSSKLMLDNGSSRALLRPRTIGSK